VWKSLIYKDRRDGCLAPSKDLRPQRRSQSYAYYALMRKDDCEIADLEAMRAKVREIRGLLRAIGPGPK
jgi:hypothetical protein